MKIEAAGVIPDYCAGCAYEDRAVKAVSEYKKQGVVWHLEHSCDKRAVCAHLWVVWQRRKRITGSVVEEDEG